MSGTGGKWLWLTSVGSLPSPGSPVAWLTPSAPLQPASCEMDEDEGGQSRQTDLRQHISRVGPNGLVSLYGGGQTSPERARTPLAPEMVPNPEPKWDFF